MEPLAPFLSRKKPILGVCRGMQVINVFFGGDLVQDWPGHSAADGADRLHASKLRRPACGRYTERTASSTAVTIRWWDSWVTIWSRYNGRMMAQWKRSATERCRCGASSGTRNACPPPTADCLTVFCSTVPFFPAGFCKKRFAICR